MYASIDLAAFHSLQYGSAIFLFSSLKTNDKICFYIAQFRGFMTMNIAAPHACGGICTNSNCDKGVDFRFVTAKWHVCQIVLMRSVKIRSIVHCCLTRPE